MSLQIRHSKFAGFVGFVNSPVGRGKMRNADMNQSVETKHERKLDELRLRWTEKFDFYIKSD